MSQVGKLQAPSERIGWDGKGGEKREEKEGVGKEKGRRRGTGGEAYPEPYSFSPLGGKLSTGWQPVYLPWPGSSAVPWKPSMDNPKQQPSSTTNNRSSRMALRRG